MLWWNRSKETKEIEKELPEDLKEFFQANNPDRTQLHKYEITPQQKQVQKVLAKQGQSYNHDLEIYKRKNKAKNASMINCSELQVQVVDCFKKLNFTSIDNCSSEIKQNKECVDLQTSAFDKLYYKDCYSIEHCDKIRFLIDHLFTKNFGQLGENMNDKTLKQFDDDLDRNFYRIWK